MIQFFTIEIHLEIAYAAIKQFYCLFFRLKFIARFLYYNGNFHCRKKVNLMYNKKIGQVSVK